MNDKTATTDGTYVHKEEEKEKEKEREEEREIKENEIKEKEIKENEIKEKEVKEDKIKENEIKEDEKEVNSNNCRNSASENKNNSDVQTDANMKGSEATKEKEEMKKEKEKEKEKEEMEKEKEKEEMEKEKEKEAMEKEEETMEKEKEKDKNVNQDTTKKEQTEKENETDKTGKQNKENKQAETKIDSKEKEMEGSDPAKQDKKEKREETKKERRETEKEQGKEIGGINNNCNITTSYKEEKTAESIISKNSACDNDDDSDYDGDNDDDNDEEEDEEEDDDDDDNECSDDVYDYDKNDGCNKAKDVEELGKISKAQNQKINDIHINASKEKNKDDANAKYKKGDYEGAVQMWERGLRSIEYVLSKKDELTEEKVKCFEKLHSTYCSNIAQGYMKLNNYSNCVKYSLQALEHDKTNEKIYFRLAKGYFLIGEYDKSIKVLQDAIQIKKDPALINLLIVVKKKKEMHLTKEKCMMKHIFQSLQKDPLTNDYDANGAYDENKINLFFVKISQQIYQFISFIIILMSLFFNQCYTFFNYTKSKFKLKKK